MSYETIQHMPAFAQVGQNPPQLPPLGYLPPELPQSPPSYGPMPTDPHPAPHYPPALFSNHSYEKPTTFDHQAVNVNYGPGSFPGRRAPSPVLPVKWLPKRYQDIRSDMVSCWTPAICSPIALIGFILLIVGARGAKQDTGSYQLPTHTVVPYCAPGDYCAEPYSAGGGTEYTHPSGAHIGELAAGTFLFVVSIVVCIGLVELRHKRGYW